MNDSSTPAYNLSSSLLSLSFSKDYEQVLSLLVASQLVFVVVLALHQPQDGAKTKPPEPRFAPDTSVRPLVIAVVCVLGLALAGILFGQG